MTQAPEAPARTRAQIGQRTLRTDNWWQTPRIVATLLTIWLVYATVRVFTGHWYFVPKYHYLTPFYSPCVSGGIAYRGRARSVTDNAIGEYRLALKLKPGTRRL